MLINIISKRGEYIMIKEIILLIATLAVWVVCFTAVVACGWAIWDFWAGVFNKWFGDGKRY